MKNAVILLRVSSVGQTRRAGAEEGYSIENQRRACLEEADRLEAAVVEQFAAPAETASKGAYRALREAIAFVQERADIDYLIVYKLDRFARDELVQFQALAELRAAGCQLVSVVENIDESPQGMMLTGILGVINAFESRNTARRVLDGLTQKARDGGTPKRVPPGYLNVRNWEGSNDIRTVELDPERWRLVEWAFIAYSTGEYTLNELTEELWERGLRTRRTSKQEPRKVARSTIARMLKDPYYIGVVRYRGVDYEGTHPTFVDPATFGQVQQILESHHLSGDKHWRHSNHVKGTVYCGYCGGRLRFTQVRGRRGGLYRYFVCGTRHSGEKCEQPYLAEHNVEDAIARHYTRTVRLDAERVAALEHDLKGAFDRVIKYREEQLDGDRRRVSKLDAERRRLLDAHLAGAVPLDLFQEKQEALAAQLATARAKVEACERRNGQAWQGLKLATRLLHDAGEAYSTADPLAQRAWNQTFFTRLFVKPDLEGQPQVVGAELTDPFGALLAEQLATAAARVAREPRLAIAAGGSNVDQIVETVGIEPTSAIA